MKKNILVVDDEHDLCELLRLYLESESYKIFTAENGKDALTLLSEEDIDMIILDIMMPEMNGYDLIKHIRAYDNVLPIIITSAKNLYNDKIVGLNLGADLYITKPYNPLEVIASVKALFRRMDTLEPVNNLLIYDDIELDLDALTIKKNNELINFTPAELKILIKLMKNPNRIFTKAQLSEAINTSYIEADENTIIVHISNIRAKLEDDASKPKYIKTIKGLGYKFAYEKK